MARGRRGGGSKGGGNKGKTSLRGRDAKTGEFVTVEEARNRPNTTTVERVPKPGYGDAGK